MTSDYKLVQRYNYKIIGQEVIPKIRMGAQPKEERVCIFCRRNSSEVTFRKEAHIIPAALGNDYLFNYEECDECNENIFSIFENDLINYLQIERILLRGRQRSGDPKYRPINFKTNVHSKNKDNSVHFNIFEGEDVIEYVDNDNQTVSMIFKNLPKYSFLGVYKAIFHMGWSLLSEQQRNEYLEMNDSFYGWLKSSDVIYPLYIEEAFTNNNGVNGVFMESWESVFPDSKYKYMFRLTFGFKIISVYIPSRLNETEAPIFYREYNHVKLEKMDVSTIKVVSSEKIKPDLKKFTFKYSEMKKNNE